jgi:DNA-directed RNA polymerase subunit RPC12/RpoP
VRPSPRKLRGLLDHKTGRCARCGAPGWLKQQNICIQCWREIKLLKELGYE